MRTSDIRESKGWYATAWQESWRPYLRPDAVTDTSQIKAGDHLVEFDLYMAHSNPVTYNSAWVAVVRTERAFRVRRARKIGRLVQDAGPGLGPYVGIIEVDSDGNDVSDTDCGPPIGVLRNDSLYLHNYGLALSDSPHERCFQNGLIKVSPHRYRGDTPSLQVPQGFINGDNSSRVCSSNFYHSVILDTQLDAYIPGLDAQVSASAL